MSKKSIDLEKTGVYPIGLASKQPQGSGTKGGVRGVGDIQPPSDFASLIKGYEDSFTVGGIAEKVASSASSGFMDFDSDQGKETDDEKTLKAFLDSIDLYALFLEMFVIGNSFIEIIRGKGQNNKQVRAERVIASTMRITTELSEEDKKSNAPYSYKQQSGTHSVTFNYSDIIHLKSVNLNDKYYGQSKFYKCIDQVALLATIDRFYEKMLDNGNLKTKLLADTANKLTDKQKEVISEIINGMASGVKNGFKTLIVPSGLEAVDLQDDSDTSAFLEYRRDLIKSICIGCTFPYDLLISDNANRSTIETSKEELNNNIIIPLQDAVLRTLKSHIKSLQIRPDEIVDKVRFKPVDISNEKEQMEIITGYKNAGVIDANESRELSPYNLPAREDGKLLTTTKQATQDQTIKDITKTISSWYTPENLSKLQKTAQCAKTATS